MQAPDTASPAARPSAWPAWRGPPTWRAAVAGRTPLTTGRRSPRRETPSCVLVPEVTEGPYFVDLKLRRSDIRANSSGGAARSGIPLELTIKIVEVGTGGRCTPYQARRSTSGTATPAVSTRPSARTPISCVATR